MRKNNTLEKVSTERWKNILRCEQSTAKLLKVFFVLYYGYVFGTMQKYYVDFYTPQRGRKICQS